ncbi:TPA: recombinase family protein [Klebsiella pneumoniae subsp. pneumoniae]|uniref:recombinase family protein n=1 Tax=Enterobacterales TaxID=91347 RepID=UPI000B9E5344|nr:MULTISPECIES: recombinase family protein [Enterobacterales]HBL6731645.1 recombinase family protein [Serratia liquefaciens]HBQ5742008.1 recombinase family protein [Klebsiella pneumoniae subsp. pneumoniae]MCP6218043.1 recombinase family protein [Klebsiella pneumoniae]MDM1702365.1 recombinase family protein [Enterobacter hormaechei]MDN0031195.1 recombinase family protein [Serratia marcescens]
MIYGYARVSTKEQNLDRQLTALEPICDVVKVEKVSGKDLNRPELQKLFEFIQSGDTLICKSIDRLARNTKDLLEVVDSLIGKGVIVKFLDNSMSFDNTPASRLILTMMGAVAEFERGIIAARRDEGIAVAKEAGKYKGKQANQALHRKVVKYLEAGTYSPDEIATLCECGRATVFRIKKEWKTAA